MEFKKITDLNMSVDIKNLYEDSFPKEELVDFYSLFSGVFKDFELYGLYKDNTLVGMAHFFNNKNFVHLNYLAIDKACRSEGYGSYILSLLKEKFNNKTIVVDIEELDDNAINQENRIRRKKFYYKNGFKDGEYCFMWGDVFMTYMNTESLNSKEFMDYIQIIFPTIKDIKKK